ncbi:MAG: hypothetical protein WCA77_01375 [Thermoplasmata archaeon]
MAFGLKLGHELSPPNRSLARPKNLEHGVYSAWGDGGHGTTDD